jgi:hypothetical protein
MLVFNPWQEGRQPHSAREARHMIYSELEKYGRVEKKKVIPKDDWDILAADFVETECPIVVFGCEFWPG